jgi:hypothetical protein
VPAIADGVDSDTRICERQRVIRQTKRQRVEQSNNGSRGAVPRRREGTRFSSPNDNEVGGPKARSARNERQRVEQSNTVG